MCGIVGYIGGRDATDVLVDGLKKLEYRGYDSAGIAVIEDGVLKVVKTKGRLADMEHKLDTEGRPCGHCGIGHTRWATHGKPSDLNAHPLGGDRVMIVHNGIIENYLQIKAFLERQGITFDTETDTETMAKLLDYYYHGDPLDAIRHAISRVRGAYAFAMIFADHPDTVYAMRNASPLIVGLGKEENFVASDIPAILAYTRDYYLLEEGEIAVVRQDAVNIIDLDGNPIHKEVMTATWDIEAAEKGGYPHFMLKEIHEQPKALRDTIAPRIDEGLPYLGLAGIDDDFIRRIHRIHITACGSAMHAGMVGKALIEQLARIPVTVEIASEFRYNNPIFTPDDLVIAISQSGETADTLAALRLAKQAGIKTLAIANVVGSSVAREADSVAYTWAGPEISVASTKAYSVQVAMMYLIATQFAWVRGSIDTDAARGIIAQLAAIPDLVERMLENTTEMQHVAAEFQNAHSAFYIGRGLDYTLSLEGSLKLKEISYIHSESYAAGELKHGTISLIEEGTPVIALASQERLFEKMLSNIKEVKARGACVFLLCKEGLDAGDAADFVLPLPALPDLFMPLLEVAPLQLFAYYMSVLRGCDVDKPRNLAKSVTVE